MQIRFKRMLSGNITQPNLVPTLKTLAAIDLNPAQYYNALLDVIIPPSQIPAAYNSYLST
ncbi:MAG: hypothetical protein MJ201_00200 [Mycoplasmoidaceae bacterium]|nr:hypothetical protein [Mycoplasmoidaceae bacterium]